MKFAHLREHWPGLLLILVLPAAQGCVIPYWFGSIWATPQEHMAFIKPGSSTRAEVMAIFGRPDEATIDESLIGYRYGVETIAGALAIGGYGYVGGVGYVSVPPSRWLILVAFGQDDVVVKAEAVEGRFAPHAFQWAKARGAVSKAPAQFVARPTPSGHGVVYLYRPGGWLLSRAAEVKLNGRTLAELERAEYVSVVVPPGSHTFELDSGWDEGRRLVSSVTLDVQPDSASYLEVRVPGSGPPTVEKQTEPGAMPKITGLRGAECFCW